MIDVSKLMESEAHLGVYVYHHGQLMRHLLTANQPEAIAFESHELLALFLKNNQTMRQIVTFSIGNVVTLRNRENGIKKCSENMLDEDQLWREIVILIVGCIPSYWKVFFEKSLDEKTIGNCTQQQLTSINKHHEDPYLFMNTSKMYANPCPVMDTQVQIDREWIPTYSSMELYLKFRFASSRYLEIHNNKAYNEEILLGQVGGYIGTLIF